MAATMIAGDLWQLSAIELSRLIALRQISPVEVATSFLERCRSFNPLINAFVMLDEAGAMKAARDSEQRVMANQRRGELDGLPVSVKDNLFVADVGATWGSRLFADFVPPCDDLPVARMRQEGAVILGKTNTPEFALAGHTNNLLFGATRNPWDVRLTPGGSSGGAAASVALGMCPLGIATDAGGSIRRPASYCGVVGLRPSNGRVARHHGFPALAHDLQVIGPIARTVADVALLYRCITGAERRDRFSCGLSTEETHLLTPLRVRYVSSAGEIPVAPAICDAVSRVAISFAQMGHHVEEGNAPFDVAEVEELWSVLPASGLARVLHNHPGWDSQVGAEIRNIAERGFALPAWRYVEALDRLAAAREAFLAHANFDLLLTPMSPAMPWSIDDPYPRSISGRTVSPRAAGVFATFVNVAGVPAITLPTGASIDGLPIGFQLVGKPGDDELLMDVAASYEKQFNSWPQPAPSNATCGPQSRTNSADAN